MFKEFREGREFKEFREIKDLKFPNLPNLFTLPNKTSLLLLPYNINLFAFGVHMVVLAGKAFEELGRV